MKLQLYMFETCPYCRRVMNNIAETGRTDVEIHDIHKNEEDYDRLVRDGGMERTVRTYMFVQVFWYPAFSRFLAVLDGLGGILIASAEAENSCRGLEDRRTEG